MINFISSFKKNSVFLYKDIEKAVAIKNAIRYNEVIKTPCSFEMALQKRMKVGETMKKALKIALSVVACLLVVVLIGAYSVYAVRGSIKNETLSSEFESGIAAADTALSDGANVRVMSSNLLVHYPSWGGTPAKPRAKMFVEILNAYKPDVVGLQEVSDEWFSCLNRNLPDGYKFISPFTTGLFVNMTAMIYNSDAVELIEHGVQKYSQGDNPRLRRVVWALFERKDDGKRFVATSTHFDLIREGKEEAEFATMETQANEMIKLAADLSEKYGCPVFSTGDFNAMEDGSLNGQYDAPEIYAKLADEMIDAKYIAEHQRSGDAQGLEVPSYDHIFLTGTAQIKAYEILSASFIEPLSDHFPIFIDAAVE